LNIISGKMGTRRPVNLIDFPSLPPQINYEVNYLLREIKCNKGLAIDGISDVWLKSPHKHKI
jgi:hypothetical protein